MSDVEGREKVEKTLLSVGGLQTCTCMQLYNRQYTQPCFDMEPALAYISRAVSAYKGKGHLGVSSRCTAVSLTGKVASQYDFRMYRSVHLPQLTVLPGNLVQCCFVLLPIKLLKLNEYIPSIKYRQIHLFARMCLSPLYLNMVFLM